MKLMRDQIRAELVEEAKTKASAEERRTMMATQMREQIRADILAEMKAKHQAREEIELILRS